MKYLILEIAQGLGFFFPHSVKTAIKTTIFVVLLFINGEFVD